MGGVHGCYWEVASVILVQIKLLVVSDGLQCYCNSHGSCYKLLRVKQEKVSIKCCIQKANIEEYI